MNAMQSFTSRKKTNKCFMPRKLFFIQFLYVYIWFSIRTLIFSCTSWWIKHISINKCNNFITLTFAWAAGYRCGCWISCTIFCLFGWRRFCRSQSCSQSGSCVCNIYIAIWPYTWIFWWTFGQELAVWFKITDRTTTARNLFTFVIHKMSYRTNSNNFKWDQNRNQGGKYYLL